MRTHDVVAILTALLPYAQTIPPLITALLAVALFRNQNKIKATLVEVKANTNGLMQSEKDRSFHEGVAHGYNQEIIRSNTAAEDSGHYRKE